MDKRISKLQLAQLLEDAFEKRCQKIQQSLKTSDDTDVETLRKTLSETEDILNQIKEIKVDVQGKSN